MIFQGDVMVHKAKTDCLPEEAGYDPEKLEILDRHFLQCIEKGIAQGASYLLAKDGKVFAHRSMGKISATEDKGDLMPDSIRPVASITKLFTTTALLQLMEKGKCTLQQPVAEFIKEFDTDMHHHITLFHLLTHTSGLYGDPGSYFEPYPDWGDDNWTLENWLKKILTGPLHFKPGTTYSYCSRGFSVLAEIVTRLSGMDYDDYIVKNIFEPLGMDNSFFFLPESKKKKLSTTRSEWNKEIPSHKKSDLPTTSFLGGGGILSNLPDLWKFSQMMLNGGKFNGKRILGRKTVEAAVKYQVKNYTSYNWEPHLYDLSHKFSVGLCWELGKYTFLPDSTYGHEGAEGAGLFIDPTERFIFLGFYPDMDYHMETWVNSLAIAWSGIE